MTKKEMKKNIKDLEGRIAEFARIALDAQITIDLMVKSSNGAMHELAFLQEQLARIE